MNHKAIFLVILFFCGVLTSRILAEEPDNATEINKINTLIQGAGANNNAITEDKARNLIKQYLEDTFNRHVKAKELRISEISFTVDWNNSTESLVYLNIGARFTNFPINSRILNGRLETQLVMRTPEKIIIISRDWRIENADNKDISIKLLVDDLLTNEARRAMTTEYIRKNYNNPIDIQLYDERTEIYGDKVYSYVSSVVNNDSIVYLRVIFEKQRPQIEKSAIFTIEGAQWLTNRAEVIFSEKFPDINDKSTSELNAKMFGYISEFHTRTIGSKTYYKNSSKIRSISSVILKSAGDSVIRLELSTIYRLDYSGLIGSYRDYTVLVDVYYQFDIERGKWIFRSMENILDSNIRVAK